MLRVGEINIQRDRNHQYNQDNQEILVTDDRHTPVLLLRQRAGTIRNPDLKKK